MRTLVRATLWIKKAWEILTHFSWVLQTGWMWGIKNRVHGQRMNIGQHIWSWEEVYSIRICFYHLSLVPLACFITVIPQLSLCQGAVFLWQQCVGQGSVYCICTESLLGTLSTVYTGILPENSSNMADTGTAISVRCAYQCLLVSALF